MTESLLSAGWTVDLVHPVGLFSIPLLKLNGISELTFKPL